MQQDFYPSKFHQRYFFKHPKTFFHMNKELIKQEIRRQKAELLRILASSMREPERSNNILRITRTMISLKKVLDENL